MASRTSGQVRSSTQTDGTWPWAGSAMRSIPISKHNFFMNASFGLAASLMRPKRPPLDVREIVRVVNFDMFALPCSEGGIVNVEPGDRGRVLLRDLRGDLRADRSLFLCHRPQVSGARRGKRQ